MKRLALVAIVAGFFALVPIQAGDKKNPIVVMETSMGKIRIELFEDKAPITATNSCATRTKSTSTAPSLVASSPPS